MSPFTDSLSRFFRTYIPPASRTGGSRFFEDSEVGRNEELGFQRTEEAESFALLPLQHDTVEGKETGQRSHPSSHRRRKDGKMKFGTLLELNSNIDWWEEYVDYDGLKKLFPSEPLDPSYRSILPTDAESSRLISTHREGVSESEFIAALDKERNKVVNFYENKETELKEAYMRLMEEIGVLEERELDDTIEEEEEEEEELYDEREDDLEAGGGRRLSGSAHDFRSSNYKAPKRGILKRITSMHLGLGKSQSRDEDDLMAASLIPAAQRRTPSQDRSSWLSNAGPRSPHKQRAALLPPTSPSHVRKSSDDLSSRDRMTTRSTDPRRASMSSVSSLEVMPFFRRGHLGLVPMDTTNLPLSASVFSASSHERSHDEGTGIDEGKEVAYIWTANSDYGKVLRIGFKKRISALWLEAHSLRQYVELNMTAFEKILKKYDKNTNSKLKKRYISEQVLTSTPWREESKEDLDVFIDKIHFVYARVAAGGDIELAKFQLRAQLREKIVVDRETVWSKMVQDRRREDGNLKVVTADGPLSMYEKTHGRVIHTPCGNIPIPFWLSRKPVICLLAVGVLVGIVVGQPLDHVEESNCLGMLLFCTILWATEAIPLFVTSFFVPFLVVALRLIKSTDGQDTRLSASDATKYIFSQMFSPTIMLLIGGFTIAAVLSKTRLDVMTATRVLNAAGTRPSVVLLCLMCVATFASMWISNVAAPTLCYALIKPITDELSPKSIFSRCLILAIALASNIGGQASPISSPQNLIALGMMDPPLSWAQWFAISLPVASVSIIAIWAFLQLMYRWEDDLRIPKMRKNTDPLTATHFYVLAVTVATIVLWCVEKSFEDWVGDMGVIAIIPIIAFFGTGILSKEDFHSFHWSIVFLAMGGIALGKAVLSSGLLDDLNLILEDLVHGMSLYSILLIFSCIALVVATFISHTIAAVLLVPIAARIGDSMSEPHPRLLIMATALICSAGMGLPVSGFPNMTAISQENKLGKRFIEASDFLKSGIPASLLALIVIVTVGYSICRALGL